MRNQLNRFIVLLFILIASFALVGTVQAGMKVTAVLKGWDYGSNKYESGNVSVYLDNTGDNWQSFHHKLNFDNALWPDACGVGTSTQWAGEVQLGMYHTDNAPAGGAGYVQTRNWTLASGEPTQNLIYNPDTSGSAISVAISETVSAAGCGGNCQDEIVTTLFVNTDTDCDGVQNANAGDLYIYWEALLPDMSALPHWGGNVQVRIGDTVGSGDKTVNVGFFGPTAVHMSSAQAGAAGAPAFGLWLVAAAVLLAGTGIMLRPKKQD